MKWGVKTCTKSSKVWFTWEQGCLEVEGWHPQSPGEEVQ